MCNGRSSSRYSRRSTCTGPVDSVGSELAGAALTASGAARSEAGRQGGPGQRSVAGRDGQAPPGQDGRGSRPGGPLGRQDGAEAGRAGCPASKPAWMPAVAAVPREAATGVEARMAARRRWLAGCRPVSRRRAWAGCLLAGRDARDGREGRRPSTPSAAARGRALVVQT